MTIQEVVPFADRCSDMRSSGRRAVSGVPCGILQRLSVGAKWSDREGLLCGSGAAGWKSCQSQAKLLPIPKTLNYPMWLGPAPWRPYQDFGGGNVHGTGVG